MRIYDIALMLIRAMAATEFVRALAGFAITAVRFVFLMGAMQGAEWFRFEITTWLTPIEALCLAGIFLLFSRPLARFAARLSPYSEIASHFE
jgi:hypothetical protein